MAYQETTVAEVLAAYEQGERMFTEIEIEGADFTRCELNGIELATCSLPGAVFDAAKLDDAGIFEVDLAGASFESASLTGAVLFVSDLSRARFRNADLADADLEDVSFEGADLTSCDLRLARLSSTTLTDATLDRAVVAGTVFSEVDLSALCDADALFHRSRSYVDLRSVLLSYRHPGLKRFLVDCGVPPSFAEYTIEAARAEGDGALASLMRSTFISYGGPDEAFARRLYDELRAHGVVTFFFPESARIGRRIGDEVHSRIQEHDRVILICSRGSLDRKGVRNEIQETFDREARDGGATYLLPITLDDYVLSGWGDPLAERVRGRVVGDFRDALTDGKSFDKAMSRLLAELRKT